MFQVIFQTKSIQRMGFLIVMKTHIPDHLLYQGSYVHKDNLVLSTGLTMWIGHCKEIQKLTLRALALHWSESRNCGLCVAYIQKDGSTLLVCKDTVRIKSADLKNNSFVLEFCGSPCFLDQCRERQQTAICYLEWLGRLKCLAMCLDVFLSSFSMSRWFSWNRSPSHLPVLLFCNFLQRVQVMQ